MAKTEFFDIAARQGFYGLEKGGLYGKKDNVRKYWEDISIKINIREFISRVLERKDKLRIADLGCGSGEGYELITHLPFETMSAEAGEFVLRPEDIELYLGVDISVAMIEAGRKNYEGKPQVEFMQADLSSDFSFLERGPFDIIFSTYSSPSHLTEAELSRLLSRIAETHSGEVIVILDLFARYSAEWPCYWGSGISGMNQYTMSWLYLPERKEPEKDEIYMVKFWGGDEIRSFCREVARQAGRKSEVTVRDRSLLVGRHIDTGYYNHHPMPLRYQVNRLLDRDFRGDVNLLLADCSFLEPFAEAAPEAYKSIRAYAEDWNTFILYTKALLSRDDAEIKKYIETSSEFLSEEMKMLAWLVRNSGRFPVVDFLASIFTPQLAAVLRNLELNRQESYGCGHGLMCNIVLEKK
ncbi:MAG: class I SAM-dependent methyltransferase [Ignavibacteriaceae bacterium]|nr:class I SAM-dependent methyltransferase [Ignavibacteriaceae bacterium]